MTSPPPRRPSFGMLLRRSKSGEFGKSGKRAQAVKNAELDRQRQHPPRLPDFRNAATDQLSKTFAPELQASASYSRDAPRISAAVNYPPVPPIPFDPYARTESMTHRGRYSYASSAVSTVTGPRRIRRRKDPTPFNVLVLGTRSAGKTSFVEFLKTALALPAHKRSAKKAEEDDFNFPAPATGNFVPHYLESESDGERVGLTLWDSEGLEKNVIDLQLREISAFLESKFDDTFGEEMKVIRSPGVQDTHIHAVLLILDPARLDRNIAVAKKLLSNGYQNGASHTNGLPVLGNLDEDLDLQVLRTLYGKTTVIPVIAKADTITTKHMSVLKRAVWDSIKKANLDTLEALGLDDDDDSESDRIDEDDEDQGEATDKDGQRRPSPLSPTDGPDRHLSPSVRRHKAQEGVKEEEQPYLPFSIISPDLYEPGVIGRRFPWGFADPYNEQHCDFQRLKEAVFTEWRRDLREASRDQWYEGWRTNRLKRGDLPYRPR